ncbi:hypothetical protein BABINDRAFT_159638 [Babjeviella inositovora NRRL Y-12698]|uniref:Uncharacterized protein n=1 Tax=Babjeviella inositovora NRRL Y-12698 TaxID=984486 RepID=A0A1E3QZX9_9ASCO|nr:uncharacterized protein BABINDRAFT_159638 [Babjeviella inositovora NRRL Y-12698]ODQ83198.1 hypothetical protein BABINDRAFT_159638 [Babjeviella inositovora NRRL Y-12698]
MSMHTPLRFKSATSLLSQESKYEAVPTVSSITSVIYSNGSTATITEASIQLKLALQTLLVSLLSLASVSSVPQIIERTHTDDHPEPELLASSVGKEINGRLVPSSSAISLLSLNLSHTLELELELEALLADDDVFVLGPVSPQLLTRSVLCVSPLNFKNFSENKAFFLEPDFLGTPPNPRPAQPRANSATSISRWSTRVNLNVQQQRNPLTGCGSSNLNPISSSITNYPPNNSTNIASIKDKARVLPTRAQSPKSQLFASPDKAATFPIYIKSGPKANTTHTHVHLGSVPDSPNLDPISVGGSPSKFWLNPPMPIAHTSPEIIQRQAASPPLYVMAQLSPQQPSLLLVRGILPAAISIPINGDESPNLMPVNTPSEAPPMTPLQLSTMDMSLDSVWELERENGERDESDYDSSYYDGGADDGPAVEL